MGKSEQDLSAGYRVSTQIQRQTLLCEAPGFAFSAPDFAKPKMLHKLEEARTIVMQGFSNMHQPFISTMLSSWNQNRELSVWVVFGSRQEDSKESLQNNHSRRDTSCPVTLKVLNPFG